MYKLCYYFFFGFGLLLLQKCSTQELDMSGNFVLVGSDQKKIYSVGCVPFSRSEDPDLVNPTQLMALLILIPQQ